MSEQRRRFGFRSARTQSATARAQASVSGRPPAAPGQTMAGEDVTKIADAPLRTHVHLTGTLRAVTLQPRGGVPALQAELSDGTGVVTIVWLGRRTIRGITAGRSVSVVGRIGVHDGVRTLYNPRYELRPS